MTSTATARSQPHPDPLAFGKRLRAREPEALERFFDRYFDTIYGRVQKLVRDTQEAEDLTQDIFLKIHRSLPRFDPERPLEPWVHSIVLNRVRDHWRARRMVRDSDRDDGVSSSPPVADPPESELERKERHEELQQAVHRLPLDMRSVLLLRIYDGLDFSTVASLLELTPAAARKRYSRALKRLRESLGLEGALA